MFLVLTVYRPEVDTFDGRKQDEPFAGIETLAVFPSTPEGYRACDEMIEKLSAENPQWHFKTGVA